jgi:hypothetical protein
MRFWLSGPRILKGLVRPGVSSLPSWRRDELRAQLKAGAIARGEIMTRKRCDYLIDQAFTTSVLDSSGDLKFNMQGSREEIIAGILERCAAWNIPMTRVRAERLTGRAIRDIRRRQWSWIMWIAIPLILAVAVLVAIVAAMENIGSAGGATWPRAILVAPMSPKASQQAVLTP